MYKSCVYTIINIIDNKKYIGSTHDFNQRKYEHIRKLRKNRHHNRYLQFAWNKYWENNFRFEVIECCFIDKLIEREQYWINFYNATNDKLGYNLCPIAGSNLGFKQSENTKRKISKANRGKKLSEHHKEKLLAGARKPKSEEHKRKLSEARRKRITKNETKEKISKSLIGNKRNKKIIKWPHILGSKCKCNECVNKKKDLYNKWHKEWRKNRKLNGLCI